MVRGIALLLCLVAGIARAAPVQITEDQQFIARGTSYVSPAIEFLSLDTGESWKIYSSYGYQIFFDTNSVGENMVFFRNLGSGKASLSIQGNLYTTGFIAGNSLDLGGRGSVTLSANTNDLDLGDPPTGLILIDASSAFDLTGVLAPTCLFLGPCDGSSFALINTGANTITLKDNDASSAAPNRFELISDIALAQNSAVFFTYENQTSKWRPIGTYLAGGGGGEANTASNLGGGLANYSTKVGVDLRFNSFDAADFDLASNLLTIDDTKWATDAQVSSAIAAGNAATATALAANGANCSAGNYPLGVDAGGAVEDCTALPAGGSPIDAWPVGSIFISTVSTNPNTLLGGGTWVAFGQGRVLVGLDSGDTDFDASEETGGAKTVASAGTNSNESAHTHSVTSNVSVDNHASHTHTYTDVVNHTHSVNIGSANDISSTTGAGNIFAGTTSSVVATTANPSGGVATGTTNGPSATLTHTTNNPAVTSGAGSAHTHTFTGSATSVVQPYIVVFMWQRTA